MRQEGSDVRSLMPSPILKGTLLFELTVVICTREYICKEKTLLDHCALNPLVLGHTKKQDLKT